MQDSGLGLILDVLIVVLLSATIYFAARLSVFLKSFRDGRAEMDHLVRTLSESVLRAQEAVTGMQQAASESGKELQQLIDQSMAISEELQLVNEAGNNLASRLEGLAERNREIVEQIESKSILEGSSFVDGRGSRKRTETKKAASSFVIRDPEFDAWDDDFDETGGAPDFLFSEESDSADWDEDNLLSQAEKELQAALQEGTPRRRVVRKH